MAAVQEVLLAEFTIARMDGEYDLVAGAFSSKPEKCLETARELGISEDRACSWKELIEKELDRPESERVQVIMITTPNHVHAAPTIAALEAGYHVQTSRSVLLWRRRMLLLQPLKKRQDCSV